MPTQSAQTARHNRAETARTNCHYSVFEKEPKVLFLIWTQKKGVTIMRSSFFYAGSLGFF